MKLIRVVHVIRSLEIAGMENVVRRVVAGLDPDRFEQIVCTIVAPLQPEPFPTVSLERDPKRAALLAPQLTKVFSQLCPDVVHSRNWAAIEAVLSARVARVPLVIHSEHGRDLQTLGRQPWRRRFLRRLCFSMATRVFCVSSELRAFYSRNLAISADRLDVVPNGVDLNHFRSEPSVRTAKRAQLGADPDTLVVGAVGRLDPVKGHSTLLQAAELGVRAGLNLRVVIVGDGPTRPALEKQLAGNSRLANSVALVGQVKNVADWLNSFDVFVLPSISEGMSNTLLEAMAVGVAPIATNVGGNPEVIEDGHSGLLVNPGDAQVLCSYLVRLAQNPCWRAQIASNARQRVAARFSLARMLERYDEMYSRPLHPSSAQVSVVSRA